MIPLEIRYRHINTRASRVRNLFKRRLSFESKHRTTTPVIIMANIAVIECNSEIEAQSVLLVKAISSTNRMKPMLNKLLPSKLLRANSGAFILTAAMDAANSGREVLSARN